MNVTKFTSVQVAKTDGVVFVNKATFDKFKSPEKCVINNTMFHIGIDNVLGDDCISINARDRQSLKIGVSQLLYPHILKNNHTLLLNIN